jgi:glycosyltransferase involved in cell wall biosynthesis
MSAMSGSQATPLVSVIIPVFNDSERLRTCLNALQNQVFHESYEVIIGDNGSTEDIAAIARTYPFAKYISQPEGGSYAARNAALTLASGSILAFTDSDCIPASDWLARGVTALEENPRSFIGGAIELFPVDAARPTGAELWEMANAMPQQKYVQEQQFAATANVFVRRTDFDTVGAFNGTMKSSGDREWGNRANASGVMGVFDPSVVIRHPCRRTLGEITRKMKRMHGGATQLKLERGENPLPLRELSVLVKPPIRSIRRGVARSRPPTRAAKTRYVLASYYIAYARPLMKLRAEVTRRARKSARSKMHTAAFRR